ncbi:YceI family protein [Winogradskyella litorisediminis]|uniref:YceI family protein n=1 Tax=Winogradskyella litorisediminis TaxID=1156618 RepID=A0ABW3N7F2_9FLAO
MKNKIFSLTILMLVIITSCKDKANEVETKDAEKVAKAEESAVSYTVDTDNSLIMWKGFKPTGSHNGVITVSGGDFELKDDNLQSGSVTIDMKSIEVLDIPKEEKGNAKLKGHLTSADFFDVETYPYANFAITDVSESDGKTMIEGNLTIKDVTNNISIPVTTTVDGDRMTLKSEKFTIDRSKWNVRYGSKSFFDDLGDSFINDDIELQIDVNASKS